MKRIPPNGSSNILFTTMESGFLPIQFPICLYPKNGRKSLDGTLNAERKTLNAKRKPRYLVTGNRRPLPLQLVTCNQKQPPCYRNLSLTTNSLLPASYL